MSDQQQPAPMTAERLSEIRARAEAASVGPWHVGSFGLHTGARDADGDIDPDQMRADMEFMASSRQDVPDLLAFAEAALPVLRAVADMPTEGIDPTAPYRVTVEQARRVLAGMAAPDAAEGGSE